MASLPTAAEIETCELGPSGVQEAYGQSWNLVDT